MFSGKRFEIQIRTVIQHAWSAVSHALQYKREAAVPSKLQRRLFRIAGLFELADEEFIAIRTDREALARDAERMFAEGVSDIPLSSVNIDSFIENWDGFEESNRLAIEAGFLEGGEDPDTSFVPDIYDISKKLNFKSVNEIEKSLNIKKNKDIFAKIRKIYARAPTSTKGFAVFLLLASEFPEAVILEDLKRNGWSEDLAKIAKSTFDAR